MSAYVDMKKKRLLLNDRQCRLFMRDIMEFGYDVTFEEIRRIANEVSDGTGSDSDPVAMILARQIDDAMDAANESRRR